MDVIILYLTGYRIVVLVNQLPCRFERDKVIVSMILMKIVTFKWTDLCQFEQRSVPPLTEL